MTFLLRNYTCRVILCLHLCIYACTRCMGIYDVCIEWQAYFPAIEPIWRGQGAYVDFLSISKANWWLTPSSSLLTNEIRCYAFLTDGRHPQLTWEKFLSFENLQTKVNVFKILFALDFVLRTYQWSRFTIDFEYAWSTLL